MFFLQSVDQLILTKMKQFKFGHVVDIRYGMASPKLYIRYIKLVIMWWGKGVQNGGLEVHIE